MPKFMKKAKSEKNEWMRAEYRREDLGPLVRGKFVRRVAAASNVVVIDPAIAKVFPNEAAVNGALRGLVELAKASTRVTQRATRVRNRTVRAA